MRLLYQVGGGGRGLGMRLLYQVGGVWVHQVGGAWVQGYCMRWKGLGHKAIGGAWV